MMIQKADYHPDLIDWEWLTPEVVGKFAEELVTFHDEFHYVFGRSEHYILGENYLQGLLSNIPRKNVEAITLEYLGSARVRSMQKFISDYRWDDSLMLTEAKRMISGLVAEENGMLTVDESGIPKKGKESVGVARQYCGNTGKVDNCQVGVFVGYTGEAGIRSSLAGF